MTQRPSFRQIASPLDVDDGALARLNEQLGVPALVKSQVKTPRTEQEPPQDSPKPSPRPSPSRKPDDSPAARKPATAAIPPRTALEKLTVELPGYLMDAIKRDALDRRSTARHVLMLALQHAGFAIHQAVLVRDARRTRRKTGNP
jgi:hypothetical protein